MSLKNLFVSVVVACSLSISAVAGDFGNVNFGMTKDEVKAAEKTSTPTSESENELIYSETSGDNKAESVYGFEDGKLVMAVTIVMTEHKDLAGYVNDFKLIDEYWKGVKGEPTANSIVYVPDYAGDKADLTNPAALGSHVAEGKAECITVWEGEKFSITHTLTTPASPSEISETVKKILENAKVGHIVLGVINVADEEAEEGE